MLWMLTSTSGKLVITITPIWPEGATSTASKSHYHGHRPLVLFYFYFFSPCVICLNLPVITLPGFIAWFITSDQNCNCTIRTRREFDKRQLGLVPTTLSGVCSILHVTVLELFQYWEKTFQSDHLLLPCRLWGQMNTLGNNATSEPRMCWPKVLQNGSPSMWLKQCGNGCWTEVRLRSLSFLVTKNSH